SRDAGGAGRQLSEGCPLPKPGLGLREPCVPGAVQHEVLHCRPGTAQSSVLVAVPDAVHRYTLHCIRDTIVATEATLAIPAEAVMTEFSPLPIDVVSDVVCPWCYIGKRLLERAIV